MEIFAGFILGLFGSLHCLGMCGPIALAIPHTNYGKLTLIVDNLLYNLGRILTYTFLGALAGTIGAGIKLAGFQETVSLIMGIILLLYLIIPKKAKTSFLNLSFIKKISDFFTSLFQKFLVNPKKSSLFVIGILNGFLPCGLVYVALAASLAGTADTIKSALFMALFGIGTTPIMAFVYTVKKFISTELKRKLTKLIPVGIALLAIILILRGLSLGIKYVSPSLPDTLKVKKSVVIENHSSGKCCEKDSK
ncbi:MAG: sulfite exporter TauE/SafE family protein [Candidatus Kapabacteria bacterium]|nr:sulfite exporter TauE/SafE family protein [Candidatus Kapabacteria bacterium]